MCIRGGPRLFGAASSGYGDCCPPVVDVYALVALLAGIALAAYFLRLALIKKGPGRRRREVGMTNISHHVIEGSHTYIHTEKSPWTLEGLSYESCRKAIYSI